MSDATKLILEAIQGAETIKAAGKQSLLAIAASALDPGVTISQQGLCAALGLHPGLLVATLVTADLAGDTLSRRDLGVRLFGALTLRSLRPPALTPPGRLAVVGWCLEQLGPLEPLLAGSLERALTLTRLASSGGEPAAGELNALQGRIEQLQRSKIVPLAKGDRSKLGLSAEDRVRRRAGQAIFALIQGLRDHWVDDAAVITVAGEVAGALGQSTGGVGAATDFCLGLAAQLDALGPGQAQRTPGNGS